MADLPPALLASLTGVQGFDRPAFEAVHTSGSQVTSVRINPAKWSVKEAGAHFQNAAAAVSHGVPWSTHGLYLERRPSFTFDPLFHAGCYYVQEASSQFVEQAFLQSVDTSLPLRVLDLCAAPGGKTTHLLSLLNTDSLLVSNELIKIRAAVLKQNAIKWGSSNCIVAQNDPAQFARLPGFFDVFLVDAPCSGSGLFRRDEDAVAEWSEAAVQLCSARQKRILADALPALKTGGVLIYATCSYSAEEDEEIADWLIKAQQFESIPLQVAPEWMIVESVSAAGAAGYRFFPDKLAGEGFYLAVFRKTKEEAAPTLKAAPLEKATAAQKAALQKWMYAGDLELFSAPYLHGLLKKFALDYAILKKALYVPYAGVALGDVIRDKLIPHHALAMSTLLPQGTPATEVGSEQAIRYLQRLDSNFKTAQKGWQLVRFHGHNLGWINALPNRINNYYPKELRILKQH